MKPVSLTWAEGLETLHRCLPDSTRFRAPKDLNFDSVVTAITSGGGTLHPLEASFEDADTEVIRKLLLSARWPGTGKVLIIPDCGDLSKPPLLCELRDLLQVVESYSAPVTGRGLFDGCSDVLLVSETGGALLIDHDERSWRSFSGGH